MSRSNDRTDRRQSVARPAGPPPANQTRPLVLLAVNNSWNVLNFRAGLIRRLQESGFDVGVISPSDPYAAKLATLGVRHITAAIDSKGLSPIADLRLLLRYHAILRKYRPVALLAWTVKPNVYGSLAAHMLGIPVLNNVSGLGTAFIRKGPLTKIVSALYRLAFNTAVPRCSRARASTQRGSHLLRRMTRAAS